MAQEVFPPEVWANIFRSLNISKLLELERVCSQFRMWLWSSHGPWSKFRCLTLQLTAGEDSFAALSRSRGHIDDEQLHNISSVARLLARVPVFHLREMNIHISVFASQRHLTELRAGIHSSGIKTMSRLSWSGDICSPNNDDLLAEVLTLCVGTLTDLDAEVCALWVYDSIRQCTMLKNLRIVPKDWGIHHLHQETQRCGLRVHIFQHDRVD